MYYDAGAADAEQVSAAGRGAAVGSDSGASGMPSVSSDSGPRDAAAGSGGADAERDDSDAGETLPTDAGVIELPADASADSGSEMSSPLCPERPGMLFCDGFEDPSFARWAYTVSHNGSVARSTARKHSGTTALLATTGAAMQGTEARYATDVLAHQKSGDAWMRFYNYVPSSVVVTQHFSIGVMSEMVTPYDGFELRILPSSVDINSSSGIYQGNVPFPRDRWVCVELHVLIDATAGIYEAYLDGSVAVRSPLTNTLPADGFTAAEIGVHYAAKDQGPVEVYVDDVVVGNSRIPCD
ncbi:MAG TPA: hypothetical protein VJV78_48665 [Polyangiales bacterium]|nr:hypothetical protein [Polyangiales bacterium]